jgi:hypothetical protein
MANLITRHMKNMTRTALAFTPISCQGIGHLVRQYVPPCSMFIYLMDGKCSVCHARFPDEGDDVWRPGLRRWRDALYEVPVAR